MLVETLNTAQSIFCF